MATTRDYLAGLIPPPTQGAVTGSVSDPSLDFGLLAGGYDDRYKFTRDLESRIDDLLDYYLGPTGITDRAASANQLLNPIRQGAEAGGYTVAAMDPSRSASDRVNAAVNAVAGTVGAAAPMLATKFVGGPATQALTDTLLNMSMPVDDATRAALRNVASDAQYAGRSLLEGDLGGVRDAFTPSREAVSLSAASPNIPRNPMLVQHNTTEAGLGVYDKLGGAPMPSIAIARADEPLLQYGDISLLLSPDQIAPSRRMTVWPADAYTGRQPKADFQLTNMSDAIDAMKADPNLSNFRDIGYWNQALDNDWRDMDETMKTVQYGIQNNVSNPSDFTSIFDYANDVRRKLGYDTEPVDQMVGMRAYGDPEMKLWPRDLYTASGNRRKPSDYTLQSVMQRMKQDKAYDAATEGGSQGAGFIRAAVIDPFRSIADIQASRGLLAPEAAMADVKDQWSSTVDNVIEDLADKYFNGRWTTAMEYLQDTAAGRSTSWANASADARSATMDALRGLRQEVTGLPTHYFEAKPKDALSISDFQGAIVPENATQALEILRNNNVQNVLTYGSDEERKALFQRFPQLMFSTAAGAGILGAALQQDQGGQM
jgi:hypothetical protein